MKLLQSVQYLHARTYLHDDPLADGYPTTMASPGAWPNIAFIPLFADSFQSTSSSRSVPKFPLRARLASCTGARRCVANTIAVVKSGPMA
jgi:hypothetical protein